MIYPVKIKVTVTNGFEATLPDMPGVKIIKDTIDEAVNNLSEAIAEHLAILVEYGEQVPEASPLTNLLGNMQEQGVIWLAHEFDITPYLGKSHKINVTLPELLIKQIDDRVAKSEHFNSRSGFIAQACLDLLRK